MIQEKGMTAKTFKSIKVESIFFKSNHIIGCDLEAYAQTLRFRDFFEEAYHSVREEKLYKGLLRKYGFRNIREITQLPKETTVDPSVREEVLRFAGNESRIFNLSLMLATNHQQPQLYTIGSVSCR